MTGSAVLKIALVGGAPSSYKLAPYKDLEWDIWVCSPQNMQQTPRATCWFDFHAGEQLQSKSGLDDFYIEWITHHAAAGKFKLYMQDASVIPHAIPFPKDELVAEFSPYFFSSSFSWMMAFAIKQGATDIGLYGVDMTTHEEYKQQRPNMQHFIWLARHRGINVTAPWESDILQPPPLYGYTFNTHKGRKHWARQVELKQRLREAEKIIDEQRYQATYLKGAMDDLDYEITTWTGE